MTLFLFLADAVFFRHNGWYDEYFKTSMIFTRTVGSIFHISYAVTGYFGNDLLFHRLKMKKREFWGVNFLFLAVLIFIYTYSKINSTFPVSEIILSLYLLLGPFHSIMQKFGMNQLSAPRRPPILRTLDQAMAWICILFATFISFVFFNVVPEFKYRFHVISCFLLICFIAVAFVFHSQSKKYQVSSDLALFGYVVSLAGAMSGLAGIIDLFIHWVDYYQARRLIKNHLNMKRSQMLLVFSCSLTVLGFFYFLRYWQEYPILRLIYEIFPNANLVGTFFHAVGDKYGFSRPQKVFIPVET